MESRQGAYRRSFTQPGKSLQLRVPSEFSGRNVERLLSPTIQRSKKTVVATGGA